MGELLGSAELETGVDLAGLDAGLGRAESRVARSVAVMQAMLDRLHADVDLRVSALEALAARGAAAIPSTGGAVGQSSSTTNIRQSGNEIWGVRGPQHAGSIQNPIVTVLAASKFYPMGSYGAAVADTNQSDAQRDEGGFATTADMAALTAAVADLARNASPVNGLATAGSQGMTEPGAAERTVVTLDRQNGDALGRAAAAMESIATQNKVSSQDERALLTALRSSGSSEHDLAAAALRVRMGGRSGSGSATGQAAADAALIGAIDRLAASDAATTLAAAAAARRGGASATGGGPFAYTFGGGGSGGGGALPPVIFGAGGGGGNKRVDVFYHSSGGGGGGGGGGGLLPALLWGGGGMLGMAGFGSLASLAGLGPEHLLMTALGIAGSAGTALAGGGLLGLGAGGVLGAGMAADASSFGQAANDIKNVVQAQNQLTQAVAQYGPKSQQAAAAQGQLNFALSSFNPVARQAVLNAANAAQAFHQLFNQATGPAEAVAAGVIQQAIQVGDRFLPTLGQAALTDANIIRTGLQPLFAWLGGPEGLGIFQDLEHEFSQQLPFAVNAGTNGLEALLRIVNLASLQTGGFTRHIDELLKKLNGMSNVQLEIVIRRLISDFRVWEHFFKALGTDIFRLFNNDVGTGRSIIVTLTEMLRKLGEWENSVKGRQDLMTIFTVHKNEVLALLHLLPLLLDPLAKLYMTVAPAATTALTDLAKAISAVVKALESIPGGSWVLAIGLLASRLGVLGRLLTGGGAAAAGAGAGVAAAEGAGAGAGAAGLGGLLGAAGRTGFGAAVTGGTETATLGAASLAEGAGAEGLAGLIAGGGAALAPLVGAIVPIAVTALGAYGAYKLIDMLLGSYKPTTTYTAGALENLLRSRRPGVLTLPALSSRQANYAVETTQLHRPGVTDTQMFTLKDIASTKQAQAALQKWYDTARSSVAVSKLNVDQLAAMAREGDRLAQIFPRDAQLIDKLNAPIKKTFDGLNNAMGLMMARWTLDAHHGLTGIVGIFDSNLKLIASKVSLSSHQGEQMWKSNIDKMVKDVTAGMLDGRIATQSGMGAINKLTDAGVKGQALTWQQQSQLILGTINSLYRAGRIPPEQYYADLAKLTQSGMQSMANDSNQSLSQQIANTKAKYQQGNDGLVVTQQQLNQQLHDIRLQGNTQASKDMAQWVAGLLSQMSQGGQVSVDGANAILTPLNTALKELGQKPVSLVTLQAINTAANTPPTAVFGQFPGGGPTLPGTGNLGTPIPGAASGALYQIGAPGQGGRDNVPLNVAGTPVMVGAGEQVAVFNRHQQPIVNMALSLLGYDGMGGLFSSVSTPNYLAGGGTIKTPSASGGGAQGTLLNAAFRMLGIDANRFLKSKHAKGSISTAGLSGSLMAIVDRISRQMGWNAGDWLSVINRESGGSMTALNKSSGAYGIAQFINGPSEYYQYGGNPNTLVGQLVAMANYIKGRYGTPTAAWASETSRGWYAAGGPVGLANFSPKAPTTKLTDMQRIKNAMAVIASLVGSPSSVGSGGDAGRMQELLNYWPQLWSIYNPNLGQPASAYITTTDALGNSIPPVIDQAGVNLSAGQLTKELGWENEYIKDLGSARGMAQTWHPRVLQAIDRRRVEIIKLRAAEAAKVKKLRAEQASKVKAVRAKIAANLKQIAAYNRQINSLNNQITTEEGKKKPNYKAISAWKLQIAGLQGKINALEKANQKLGGAGTYVGTGGDLAAVQKEYGAEITGVQKSYGTDITALSGEISTLSGYSSALAAMPGTISGQTGVGGLLGSASIQQHTLGNELAQLQPGQLNAALATAASQYTASGAGSSSTSSNLASLLEQQNLTLAEQLAVSQAQYKVLAAMPPYAGVFHRGGVVPGPVGSEVMIRAQGGEIITPIGGKAPGTGVRVKVEDHRTRVWVDDVEQIVEKKTRQMASAAGRARPSQRRGLIAPLR